jgi:hypothetical protein
MVEPAIGITAAAIATLRPLFKNFLNFTSKKRGFSESETSFADSTRPCGDRGLKSRGSGQSYTPEFADMLGLSRFGVTTTVTAAKPPTWRERRRLAKADRREKFAEEGESQTELNYVKKEDFVPDVPEWNIGIQRTMTMVIDE